MTQKSVHPWARLLLEALPEHRGSCTAHPTALFTVALEQRAYIACGFPHLQNKIGDLI